MTRYSFQQIDRPGAKWGIKCSADLGGATGHQGQTVTVYKRDGSSQEVTLGAMIDSWNGARAAVYLIARNGSRSNGANYARRNAAAAAKAQRDREARETMKALGLEALRNEYREARAALRSAEQNLADYDPADHEWFDGETEIQAAFENSLRNRIAECQSHLADIEKAGKTLAGIRA